MDILIVIILCLLGLVLILVEIFLIPGLTITAVAGLAFSLGGVYYAFSRLGTAVGIITLLVMLVCIGVAFVYLIKSNTLEKTIGLQTDINSSVASEDYLHVSVGDEGKTLSRLNPVGKVKVNGITFEAKSQDDFIDEDSDIIVLKVTPMQLTVKIK